MTESSLGVILSAHSFTLIPSLEFVVVPWVDKEVDGIICPN